MKIALDARRLQDRPYTGVGRRLAHLLPFLAQEVDIVLLTDARRDPPYVGDFEVVRLPVPGSLAEPYWLQVPVANWLRHFDGTFHGTYNAVPFLYRGPSVVSIYDLTWEHHPEDYSSARRLSLMTQARWSVRHAGAVITCSEHVRHDLITTYKLNPEKVFNAPPAADPQFSPERVADLAPILKRLGVDGPYVVALGGARRRGLEVAVEAWRRLPEPGRPMLVVVGVDVPPALPGIVHAGRLNDEEWSAVLAGAMVFCFPTRFEGYGMPAIEAAASGVPVVCAPVSSLPEVLGDAAEWSVSPRVDDMATALARVVADEGRRAALRAAGLAQAAAAPTWEHSAQVELQAYRMVHGRTVHGRAAHGQTAHGRTANDRTAHG
jgi:glycosyltransferase involved in cell wall biosynthesis